MHLQCLKVWVPCLPRNTRIPIQLVSLQSSTMATHGCLAAGLMPPSGAAFSLPSPRIWKQTVRSTSPRMTLKQTWSLKSRMGLFC